MPDSEPTAAPEPGVMATPATAGEPPDARRPIRKRHFFLLLGVIAVVVGLLYGVTYYLHARHYEETDDAAIEADVVTISPRIDGHIAELLVNDNQKVQKGQVLARIDPRDYINEVNKAQAEYDSAVAEADQARVSLELTSVTAHADFAQATSGVAAASSGEKATQAQVAAARNNISSAAAIVARESATQQAAQASLDSAQVVAARDQADFDRANQLRGQQILSEQELDHAKATAQDSKAKVDVARRQVASAQSSVAQARAAQRTAEDALQQMQSESGQARAVVGQAQSALQRADTTGLHIAMSALDVKKLEGTALKLKSQLDQAKLNLTYTNLTAPTSGTVTKRAVEIGTYVLPGQPAMAVVPNSVWVVANFKETQLGSLKAGQDVEITVDAYPDQTFKGHVDSIQSGTGGRFTLFPPENATGNFIKVVQRVPVKILFDAGGGALPPFTPGMSVIPAVRVR